MKAVLLALLLMGCGELGTSTSGGCSKDADCGKQARCSVESGICVSFTTPLSPPPDGGN